MNRIFTLFMAGLLCALSSKAVLKTWVGASGGGWNTAGNWSPSGVPTLNDTALFNTSVTVSVSLNPSIAALQVKNNATVIFSAGATQSITIGNGGTSVEALLIEAGSSLTLGSGGFAVSIQTYGSAVTNTANVYGTLILGELGSAWVVAPFSSSFNNCIANIYGTVQVASNNTGSVITGTATNNLRFYAGSFFQGQRNGGSVPGADYQNGSTINITGVTSSNVSFNTSSNFNGLINWNCAGQTISGGFANILPSASITIDSLRIVATGTGTVRLNTNPAGFTIGHLQVDGGTLELSAPGSSGRTGTISTNFVIGGGNVIGNATFPFDNIAPDSMRLTVNGNFIMSNGSFDLSNRPVIPSGGSFGMVVKGFFVQTGGTITASSSFAGLSPSRINYIQLQGTALQQLLMNNWTGPIQLIADNSNGVLLLSNITCPDTLYLKSGYMQLDNNHIQVAANKFKTQAVLPTPHFVTSGTGHVTFTSLASFATAVFPVSPMANSISSVILKNNGAANTFDVRVERGNNPSGIFNTGLTVNRTWIINDATTTTGTVDLTFMYPDTVLNGGAGTRGTAKELGHFVGIAWNVDPIATTRIPVQGGASPAIDTTGPFAPNTLDSAFVLGEQFSILSLRTGIALNYFKGNKRGTDNLLNWAVNCTSNQAKFEIQRSGNGISFTPIANITASFDRCLQPFDFTDNNPLAGLNYYRIKITDIDGTVTYSTFVLLQNKACAPGGMAMVPTLVNRPQAVICLDAATATPLQFVITDINGRLVQTVKETAATGQNQFTINLDKLAPGLYYLSAYSSNQKWSAVRFVKL